MVTAGSKTFQVSELIYWLVQGKQQGLSDADMARLVNAKLPQDQQLTAEKIAWIVSEKIAPLGLLAPPSAAPAEVGALSGVRWRKTIVRFEQIRWLLTALRGLFSPVFFFTSLAVVVGLNAYLMNELLSLDGYVREYQASQSVAGDCLRGLRYMLYFYPLILVILFMHEIGHAAASYRFGVKPNNIGFGIYLIFPVLYADVTGIWQLSKLKRTIVNLGGIYIQLIANLLLISWIFQSNGDFDSISTARYLIQINLGTVLINLIPFLKFDGYWLYSDLFSLPNLRQQSSVYFIRFINRIAPAIPLRMPPALTQLVNPKNPFLLVYSLMRYAFLVYFMATAFQLFFRTAGQFPGGGAASVAGSFGLRRRTHDAFSIDACTVRLFLPVLHPNRSEHVSSFSAPAGPEPACRQ